MQLTVDITVSILMVSHFIMDSFGDCFELSLNIFPILVILDSDGMNCQQANFLIGTETTSTRQWTIRVTQYTCAEQDTAGPPGCLQYYTQTSNYIQK